MLEFYFPVDQREKSVIGPHSDVVAGMDGGASLSHDDVAGGDIGSVSLLDAKSLRFGVTAVLGGADALLMSKKLS